MIPMAWSVGALTTLLCSSQLYPLDTGPPTLRCAPQVARDGDTVVLSMAVPHPTELAVRHPDGTVFFLVYERTDSLPLGWKPIHPKKSFGDLHELRLKVSEATGTPWVSGRDVNERIFSKSGDYEFILTDVLETDADYPTFRCKVRYTSGR